MTAKEDSATRVWTEAAIRDLVRAKGMLAETNAEHEIGLIVDAISRLERKVELMEQGK